jgi:energy-coupling factor transporter transmembrane protein EcfT
LAGATVFATCLVAPAGTWSGSLLTMAVAAAWIAGCRPPTRVMRAFVLLGLALFLPYLLLVPLLQTPFKSVWPVFVGGTSTLLVSVATVTSLSPSDVGEGLARLPLPGVVSAILIQIVHQTATLAYETRQIASAMAVRGAAGSGRTAWRVLGSLPRVWLPRIMLRAEREAAAMQLRGYSDQSWRSARRSPWRVADGLVLGLVTSVLAAAVALRFWGTA